MHYVHLQSWLIMYIGLRFGHFKVAYIADIIGQYKLIFGVKGSVYPNIVV